MVVLALAGWAIHNGSGCASPEPAGIAPRRARPAGPDPGRDDPRRAARSTWPLSGQAGDRQLLGLVVRALPGRVPAPRGGPGGSTPPQGLTIIGVIYQDTPAAAAAFAASHGATWVNVARSVRHDRHGLHRGGAAADLLHRRQTASSSRARSARSPDPTSIGSSPRSCRDRGSRGRAACASATTAGRSCDGLSFERRSRVASSRSWARTARARRPRSRSSRATAAADAGQVRVLGLDPGRSARELRGTGRPDAPGRRDLPAGRPREILHLYARFYRRPARPRRAARPGRPGRGRPTPATRSCPAARSSAWASPWRSSDGPSWRSSTSPLRAWTRPPRRRPGSSSAGLAAHGTTVLLTTHELADVELHGRPDRDRRPGPDRGRRHAGRARGAGSQPRPSRFGSTRGARSVRSDRACWRSLGSGRLVDDGVGRTLPPRWCRLEPGPGRPGHWPSCVPIAELGPARRLEERYLALDRRLDAERRRLGADRHAGRVRRSSTATGSNADARQRRPALAATLAQLGDGAAPDRPARREPVRDHRPAAGPAHLLRRSCRRSPRTRPTPDRLPGAGHPGPGRHLDQPCQPVDRHGLRALATAS